MIKFKLIPIVSWKKEAFKGKVYDFEVENNHSYTVSDRIIVHNSMCTTRRVTGHGVPNLSTIMQCRRAINGLERNVSLIADGGIRNSGDIVKALAAGADSVMIGNLFSGTEETPGKRFDKPIGSQVMYMDPESFIENESGRYKKYRGQSSKDFMDDLGKSDVAAEGEHMYVPYKGSVLPIIDELVGGIRSGMSYSGVYDLEQLSERSIAIEIGHHGYIESTPHGKISNV